MFTAGDQHDLVAMLEQASSHNAANGAGSEHDETHQDHQSTRTTTDHITARQWAFARLASDLGQQHPTAVLDIS
jgi:hypothetical protein